MMDVYYAVCRFWCCCPGNDDREHQPEWRQQQKKDIEKGYVLHHQDASSAAAAAASIATQNHSHLSAETPTHSAKYVAVSFVIKLYIKWQRNKNKKNVNKRSAEGATAVVSCAGVEEDSQLLKEVRSSSLKTEMYRQIWQRRVLWFGQTLPSFESRSTIEFWSGWTNRSNGGHQTTSGGSSSKPATTPPASSSSTSRRKKYQ